MNVIETKSRRWIPSFRGWVWLGYAAFLLACLLAPWMLLR